MRRPLISALLLAAAVLPGRGDPDRARVLALMERVADWQLTNINLPGPFERAPDAWIKGAFYTGVMALARDASSPRFHDAMMQMGAANQWKPARRPYHADDHVVAQTYLDFAVEEWWVASDYLYDKEEHLYFRDSTLFGKREKNGRKIFWSRGNGWVMGGLVRMLELLPADHPSRPRFVQQFREMAAKVITCQQADGLWRASLLDPGSYPMQETSGSGFYCYALAWGVNEGLLPRATYEPVVRRAWAALTSFVQPDGKLTHVQPVGFTPVTFDENHTEPYGVGAFLLAGREVYRLP